MSATSIEQLGHRYDSEVRFHDLVNYLTGLIRSDSFTGKDVRDAALLAANKAKAERITTPARFVAPHPEDKV